VRGPVLPPGPDEGGQRPHWAQTGSPRHRVLQAPAWLLAWSGEGLMVPWISSWEIRIGQGGEGFPSGSQLERHRNQILLEGVSLAMARRGPWDMSLGWHPSPE